MEAPFIVYRIVKHFNMIDMGNREVLAPDEPMSASVPQSMQERMRCILEEACSVRGLLREILRRLSL